MSNKPTLGITHISQIPMREYPSHKSQMVNQLIFGESYEVLEFVNEEWIFVKCIFDGYEGYIAKNQFFLCEFYISNNFVVKSKIIDISFLFKTSIGMGCELPNFNNGNFKLNNTVGCLVFNEKNVDNNDSENKNLILERTKQWLNVPYLWGGRTIFGVDCSGFTQIIYKTLNVKLPRDAYQQATIGEDVYFVEQAKCGDLAFFDNEDGKIIHVGIILEDKKIIHASGMVKIDILDHKGIYCKTLKKYTHKLRLIKRILE